MKKQQDAVCNLLSKYFSEATIAVDVDDLSHVEREFLDKAFCHVKRRFSRMKYILGLALNFTLLAQQLASYDKNFLITQKNLSYDEIFEKFSLVKRRGGITANTLTFKMHDGTQFGIRKIEEQIVDFFHGLKRGAYPSAYVYNTGQWRKFNDLLLLCFILGETARCVLVKKLLDFGLSEISENSFWTREIGRVRVFDSIIASNRNERIFSGQNGGLILQAIFYGFYKADRPHLNFIVDKVRAGSSRQHRFGDIDGYFGADLELSCEVKDMEITTSNLERQCGSFLKSCEAYGILGIIACEEASNDARKKILASGCLVVSIKEMRRMVAFWDWVKQDAAFCSCLHYISHVEQDADATIRMLKFVKDVDDSHSMLAYLKPDA